MGNRIEDSQGVGRARDFSPENSRYNPPPKKPQIEQEAKRTKVAAGIGLGTALGLGLVMKDGFKSGLNRIAHTVTTFSHILSAPASILFFPLTLANEFFSLTNVKTSKHDPNNSVYSIFSLTFAPNTFSIPLAMGTRSTPHLIATLLNSIHTAFTFFSFTGGRLMSTLKSFQLMRNKDKTKEYRLEQEFESLFTLGNLGSAQASVIPMAGQCVLGWETIIDILKGNFGSALDRFKKEPITVALGTLFNSWMWPFEYIAKIFDTTIRTAEMAPQFQNAFPGRENNSIIKLLNGLKEKWHTTTKDKTSTLGGWLKKGRTFSKAWSLVGPPVGMVSVVVPAAQKYLKGDFWNEEAQEIGGVIGAADKAFNVLGLLSYLYYTGTYALFVRVPQTVTTSAFYITNLMNKLRRIDTNKEGYENNPRYIDPNTVKDKIFNRPFINKISDWAEKKLQELDYKVHGKSARKIDHVTKESGFLRNLPIALAQEVIWEPIREKHYEKLVNDDKVGKVGIKPTQEQWENYLRKQWKDYIEGNPDENNMVREFEPTLDEYLRKSVLFDNSQVEYCKTQEDWKNILQEAINLMHGEMNASKKAQTDDEKPIKIKSKSLLDLLHNPKDLMQILSARTFHIANTILPLFVRGFVNIVDFGRKGEPFWYRNWKAQETGIRIGDIEEACKKEYMPVVSHAFASVGKSLAIMYNLLHGKLPSVPEAH